MADVVATDTASVPLRPPSQKSAPPQRIEADTPSVNHPTGAVTERPSESSAADVDNESSTMEKQEVSGSAGHKIVCRHLQDSCWYLPLSFDGGRAVRFLVDSGSEVTLVATSTFRREPALRNLELHDPGSWQLCGVAGESVKVRGLIDLPITLEGTTYPTEAVVADIGTAGIVGINFLREHQISANFGTGELGVRGTCLFLQRKASVRSFQLRVARATVVTAV